MLHAVRSPPPHADRARPAHCPACGRSGTPSTGSRRVAPLRRGRRPVWRTQRSDSCWRATCATACISSVGVARSGCDADRVQQMVIDLLAGGGVPASGRCHRSPHAFLLSQTTLPAKPARTACSDHARHIPASRRTCDASGRKPAMACWRSVNAATQLYDIQPSQRGGRNGQIDRPGPEHGTAEAGGGAGAGRRPGQPAEQPDRPPRQACGVFRRQVPDHRLCAVELPELRASAASASSRSTRATACCATCSAAGPS